MAFSRLTQGSVSSLVYTVENFQRIDMLTLGMLKNNEITGVIPVVATENNGVAQFSFDITSKISLHQLSANVVSKNMLVSILISICESIIEAETYMLDKSSFLINQKFIFVDLDTNKTSLICLPISKENSSAQKFNDFTKSLFFNLQFASKEDMNFAKELLNYIDSHADLNLSEFKYFIQDQLKASEYISQDKLAAQSNEIQEEVLSVHEARSVSPVQPVIPYIKRDSTLEKFYLSQELTKIGIDPNNVDYVIKYNPTVSRCHAHIVCRDGFYFISDQKSTNSTYVQGVKLNAFEEVRLDHNYKIRLSNEDFTFYIG